MLQRVPKKETSRFDEFDVALYSEQLHLRNYDEERRYEVTVRVTGDGPERVQTYDLDPMERQSVIEIVPPGRYEVHLKG
ncbi:MAG: hypothetical protein ACQET5_13360 [Halobacteriota archaeon]